MFSFGWKQKNGFAVGITATFSTSQHQWMQHTSNSANGFRSLVVLNALRHSLTPPGPGSPRVDA